MSSMVSLATKFLSSLTLIGQLAVLGILVASIMYKKRKSGYHVLCFVAAHSIGLSFLVALTATLGSLFYSEIAGYEPCKLCWFQRIFMYPLVLLLGMAIWKKDNGISSYAIAMSAIGAIIAGYHYLLQIGAAPALVPCSTVGYSVSCAQKFSMNFGYITIPLMSLTAFLLIFLFLQPNKMLLGKSE